MKKFNEFMKWMNEHPFWRNRIVQTLIAAAILGVLAILFPDGSKAVLGWFKPLGSKLLATVTDKVSVAVWVLVLIGVVFICSSWGASVVLHRYRRRHAVVRTRQLTHPPEQAEELLPECSPLAVLRGQVQISTRPTFKPPVEITVVAKTDSTNIRLAYAADQVIFNWEVDPSQLRVDGGPADGQYKPGAGRIPSGQYVTIRWVVTKTQQAIFVDDQLRFEHSGDYSQIDNNVRVFPAEGSIVTVKSIDVRHL